MLSTIHQFLTQYEQWLYYLAIVSIAFFILSLLFIPLFIARIPSDYFLPDKRPYKIKASNWRTLLITLLRATLGLALILAGIVMLILPGQGILTVLAGLFIADFPGKYKIERYIVQKPAVLDSINWLRRKQNITEIRLH